MFFQFYKQLLITKIVVFYCCNVSISTIIFCAGRGGGGGSSGGGRGGGRNQPKATPTAEELDAELDAYSKEMK